jgi:tRNA (guanine-N7-)-methyltransferase
MNRSVTIVRTYVLRQGRMTPAQARACRELYAKHGIEYRQQVLDLDATFGRPSPKILEIGFGMGEATAEIARQTPELDYIAVEVHTPGVGRLLNLIEHEKLSNVKVIRHDALEVLRDMIAPEKLAGIHVFFPDPWPKKRHHKRRLVNREFAALCRDRLRSGGYVHLATDWEPYAEAMAAAFAAGPGFTAGDPRVFPRSKFAAKGEQAGRETRQLFFTRQ